MKKYFLTLVSIALSLNLTAQRAMLTNCSSYDPNGTTIEQADKMLDLAILGKRYACGLIIFNYLKTKRTVPFDTYRAGICEFYQNHFQEAKGFLEASLDPAHPLESNYYFLGETMLKITPADLDMATEYFEKEIAFFKNSADAYLRLQLIYSDKQEWQKLINLEMASEYNNTRQDTRIAGYYLRLNQPANALVFAQQGCASSEPDADACYYAYLSTNASDKARRIGFLKSAITVYTGYYENLTQHLGTNFQVSDESRRRDTLEEWYRSRIASIYLDLAEEYHNNGLYADEVSSIDFSIKAATGTKKQGMVFRHAIGSFVRLGIPDRILSYDAVINKPCPCEANAYNEVLEIYGAIKQQVNFLDDQAVKLESKPPAYADVLGLLQRYDDLKYDAEFDQLAMYYEGVHKNWPSMTRYNLICAMHYSKDKAAHEKYRNNISDANLENKDSVSKDDLSRLLLVDFEIYFIQKRQKEALVSVNSLPVRLATRGEALTDRDNGLIELYRGMAYLQLCKSVEDCKIGDDHIINALKYYPELLEMTQEIVCNCDAR